MKNCQNESSIKWEVKLASTLGTIYHETRKRLSFWWDSVLTDWHRLVWFPGVISITRVDWICRWTVVCARVLVARMYGRQFGHWSGPILMVERLITDRRRLGQRVGWSRQPSRVTALPLQRRLRRGRRGTRLRGVLPLAVRWLSDRAVYVRPTLAPSGSRRTMHPAWAVIIIFAVTLNYTWKRREKLEAVIRYRIFCLL